MVDFVSPATYNPLITLYMIRLSDPCREDGVQCEPTYSTRHSLSLTPDAARFAVSKH